MYSTTEILISVLSFTLTSGWLIATKHKMWKICFAGYWIVTGLFVLMLIRIFELVDHSLWLEFHLVSLNGFVFLVLGYGLVSIYKAKNQNRRKDDNRASSVH